MEPKRVGALLDLAERVLNDSTQLFDDHDHRREAEELMAAVLEVDEEDLDVDEPVPRRRRERFLSLVARRAGGEPFPLLIGFINFFGYDLRVNPGMFVPRPSSELLVERGLKKLMGRKNPVVVDVATGTGPIALAIAAEVPSAEVWGTDIAKDMVKLGRSNARELEIDNVRFKVGDMYGALPPALEGRVDVITGHVPYVPKEELEDLPAEVREDETDDGLFLMRMAIGGAAHWLKPGGWLLLELSHDLEKKVRRMNMKAGLEDQGAATDEDDLSIVVEARKTR